MAKSGSNSSKKGSASKWIITVFFATVFISAAISFLSEELMSVSGMFAAFVVLLVIVFIGIFFDMIGVAVTSANETPFHSMASRRVRGAQESIRLLRSAERVSSICNDVIGDICGVVSGSASATIAAQMLAKFRFSRSSLVALLLSSMVAALTVGGKAVGKTYAIRSCTQIVFAAGKTVYAVKHLGESLRPGKKNKGSSDSIGKR